MEKEILGSGFEKIKCDHCGGTGKCDCYSCCDEWDRKSRIFYWTKRGSELEHRVEEWKEKMKGKIEVTCSHCNGLGFLFVDMEGNIIVPKIIKKEE